MCGLCDQHLPHDAGQHALFVLQHCDVPHGLLPGWMRRRIQRHLQRWVCCLVMSVWREKLELAHSRSFFLPCWTTGNAFLFAGYSCGTPPTVGNATVALSGGGVYPTGRATYTCNAGYQLQGGVSTMSCGSDKNWGPTQPVCVGIKCQDLSLGNGTVSYSNGQLYPSTATFSCSGNRFLNGASSLQCLTDGSWSGRLPTCVTANVGLVFRNMSGKYEYSFFPLSIDRFFTTVADSCGICLFLFFGLMRGWRAASA